MTDVAIVIVNWNTRDLLLGCLASLPAATAGITAETWVVDNCSSDDSPAAVREQFPEVRIIANRSNVGFAAANNQAIASSKSRHVLLINSDTVAHPDSVAMLTRYMDASPQVGIVGAHLRNGDGSLQSSWAAFPSLWSELTGQHSRPRWAAGSHEGAAVFRVSWVSGACLLIRRAMIDTVGPMDEQYFMYSEETDWCYRAVRAGWQVHYHTGAEVTHFGGQSSKQASTLMKAQLYRSKLRFFQKHYGPQATGALVALLEAGFLAKALLGGLHLGKARDARRAAARLDATVILRTLVSAKRKPR